MKTTLQALFLVVMCCLSGVAFGQGQEATISIQNMEVQDNVLYFDVFARTNTGSVHLGDADLVIDIKATAFNNPVFNKTANPSATQLQFGYVDVLPANAQGGIADDAFRMSFYNNTSVELADGKTLIINFRGVAPTDQAGIENNTPEVTDAGDLHRLGRFQVSGVSNADLAKQLSFESAHVVPSDAFGYAVQGDRVRGNRVPLNFEIKDLGSTNVEETVTPASSYELFPVPAIDNATLDYTAISKDELNVQIMDVNGRVLISFTEDVNEGLNRIDLDLSKLSAGTYMIQMAELASEQLSTDKLVVIRP